MNPKRYIEIQKIGEGAFGVVVKARDRQSGETVALKKVRLKHYGDERAYPRRSEGEAIPNHILREVKALRQLGDHPNVIKLHDVFAQEEGGPGLTLVFELMHTDLHKVLQELRNKCQRLTESQVKGVMKMLLCAVDHCHKNSIIHRDLKPSNLLIDEHGVLKLGLCSFEKLTISADFGLSRVYSPKRDGAYTNQVMTRWYKPPELLFGSRSYGPGIDLWGVGCIFGELLSGSPLFRGENDIDQLHRIIQVLGTPNHSNWPGVTDLPDFNKITFADLPARSWSTILPDVSEDAVTLLSKFLVYPPHERISAENALLDDYFFSEPLPCPPHKLPIHW